MRIKKDEITGKLRQDYKIYKPKISRMTSTEINEMLKRIEFRRKFAKTLRREEIVDAEHFNPEYTPEYKPEFTIGTPVFREIIL